MVRLTPSSGCSGLTIKPVMIVWATAQSKIGSTVPQFPCGVGFVVRATASTVLDRHVAIPADLPRRTRQHQVHHDQLKFIHSPVHEWHNLRNPCELFTTPVRVSAHPSLFTNVAKKQHCGIDLLTFLHAMANEQHFNMSTFIPSNISTLPVNDGNLNTLLILSPPFCATLSSCCEDIFCAVQARLSGRGVKSAAATNVGLDFEMS